MWGVTKIVSISLNKEILEEIDNIKTKLGFSCRSEVVRTAIRMLIADNKEKEDLRGRISSVLLVIHDQKTEDVVTQIKHNFEDITKTQLHSHLKNGKCLEIFILEGEAEKIGEIVNLFQANKKMEYVKLIVP